jgi:glucokinase
MNDFQANAFGLINLDKKKYVTVCGKESGEDRVRVILGPGTGLGV